MSAAEPRPRGASLKCTECGSKVTTVYTEPVTPSHREICYECTNVDCRHRFLATLSFLRTIVTPLRLREGVPQPHSTESEAAQAA